MANVIPSEGLLSLRRRMSARFLLVGSLMLATSALLGLLAILPAYVSVTISRATLESSTEAAAQSSSGDQAAAQQAQGLITLLTPLATATSSPATALAAVLAQKPVGISVTTISYVGGAKKTLVLSGIASRREAVNQFRDALEKTGLFSSVAVPVAALVGTQDGRFTMTLSGTF
ncbi:MAG: PilN domain-containing protein [Minisyncoccia bacterium]